MTKGPSRLTQIILEEYRFFVSTMGMSHEWAADRLTKVMGIKRATVEKAVWRYAKNGA